MTSQAKKPKLNTLNDIFYTAVEREQPSVMLYQQLGKWKSVSSRELYRRVTGVARELLALGIRRGDRVAILSENRPEWPTADFAILMIGAITVPIYSTLTSDQCEFVLCHSGARAIFCSSLDQVKKLRRIRKATSLEHLVAMDEIIAVQHCRQRNAVGRKLVSSRRVGEVDRRRVTRAAAKDPWRRAIRELIAFVAAVGGHCQLREEVQSSAIDSTEESAESGTGSIPFGTGRSMLRLLMPRIKAATSFTSLLRCT